MKVILYAIGKTNEKYLKQGIEIYLKRLKHYTKFELHIVKDVKAMRQKEALLQAEGEELLKQLNVDDYIVLLDEGGDRLTSVQFARFIEQKQLQSTRRLVFIIGGAFGFAPAIYEKAHKKLSLSDMTFSHQMIRLFFVEQLYRGFTIIRNEKYHNP